ncbi:MAG TPA: hypothetical protein VJT10_15720 [Steroidobacteraceae bacterium]|nr:hypothetical protein [Steroidobacteraceae bacterium]
MANGATTSLQRAVGRGSDVAADAQGSADPDCAVRSRLLRHIINFDGLVETGTIAAEHRELFEFADSPEEAWQSIERRGLRADLPA